MTCIVGMVDKNNNRVVIGGDSAAVGDNIILLRKDPKIFKNKDFVIGCTVSFRMIQLLRFSFIPPDISDKNIYQYMCTDFIDAVRECFKNGGFIQKYEDGDEKGGTFLVAYKDRLFKIENDFQVGEAICGFDACGSGKEYALGALFSLQNTKLTIEEIIIKSLEAAEYLSPDVSSPFVLLNT